MCFLIEKAPSGVGIDSPMGFSSGPSGDRSCDKWIRTSYRGRVNSSTVQPANSLRGAALVQAAMFAERIREKFSGIKITESHPKAILDGPGIQTLGNDAVNLVREDTEHERDAIIAALCAREGFSGRWKNDLARARYSCEQNPDSYWLAPMNYFWPES